MYTQVFIVTLELFLRWLFVDRGGEIDRTSMQIQVKQSVLEYQPVKNQLFCCKNLDKLRETNAVSCENSINKELLKEQNGF